MSQLCKNNQLDFIQIDYSLGNRNAAARILPLAHDEGIAVVVHNGSALFSGDAGGGESNIRRHIIENDWLECIVALPKDLFYNTGINTYIWFLTNKKADNRKGKVQLINGNASKVIGTNAKGKEETEHIFARSNKKSLGNKRNEFTQEHINELLELYTNFEENQHSKIFENDDLGTTN